MPVLGVKNNSTISHVINIIINTSMTASCDGPCIVKIAIAWSFEGHGKWIRGDWTLIENVETMGTKQRKNEPM